MEMLEERRKAKETIRQQIEACKGATDAETEKLRWACVAQILDDDMHSRKGLLCSKLKQMSTEGKKQVKEVGRMLSEMKREFVRHMEEK
jgi:hypothetical protein